MSNSLPANNGSRQVLRFKNVKKMPLRDTIATGVLTELEFGLLKGSSKSSSSRSGNDELLGWGVEEKGMLLNMEVDELHCQEGTLELEVQVRSLCYSRGVTADYLQSHERFNMKQCVLALGNLGKGTAPWAELVQPALHLHKQEFNIVWVEVPAFSSNPALWLKYGAELLRGLLKFLCVKQVSVIATGIGGAVFLEALAKAPDLFARTHLIFNMDIPPGKGVQLPIFEIEEVLRKRELQLWFAYKDDETYDRTTPGSAQLAYDAVAKLQTRMLGERQRSKRVLNYDEVLISENLNLVEGRENVQTLTVSIYSILVFSRRLLESMSFFLEVAPGTHQDNMEAGLVGDFREMAQAKVLAGDDHNTGEPLAVRRTRIGHLHGLQDRKDRAKGNKKRLGNIEEACDMMKPALPALQNGSYPGFPNELAMRLEDQGSRGSRSDNSGSQSRLGTKSAEGSRFGTKSIEGSPSVSRFGTKSVEGSRAGTKDWEVARGSPGGNSRSGTKDSRSSSNQGSSGGLPALRGSTSSPSLALANFAANDSDEETEEGSEASWIMEKPGEEPWQSYRRMWAKMHGKAPSGYTAPMHKLAA